MMKLRPVGGLSHLRLIGVRNERSIRDFKHGFVKEGGIFTLGTGPHSTTVTVSNQGTTMVSKAVREILQRNSLLIH